MAEQRWRFVELDSDRWVLEHGEGMSVPVLYSNESNREYLLRVLNAHDALVAALEDVEWAMPANLDDLAEAEVCPWCAHHRDDGHHATCRLGSALKAALLGERR